MARGALEALIPREMLEIINQRKNKNKLNSHWRIIVFIMIMPKLESALPAYVIIYAIMWYQYFYNAIALTKEHTNGLHIQI